MRFFAIGGLTYLSSLALANFISGYYLLLFFCVFIFAFSLISYFAVFSYFKFNKIEEFSTQETCQYLGNVGGKKPEYHFRRGFNSLALWCLRRINQATTFCIFGIVAVLISAVNYRFRVVPVTNLDGENITVTGSIMELPSKDKSGGYHYVFKVKYIHGIENPKNFKLSLFSSSPIEADIYDELTVNVTIFLYYDTPEFPERSFYRAKGIYAGAFLYSHNPAEVKALGRKKPLYYYTLKLRKQMLIAINSIFPGKQAAVVSGMLLGDKSMLSLKAKADFDRVGVYYLFAVSGFHVAIIGCIFLLIFKKLNINKRKSALITAFLILMFMFVSCFTPSVVRAGIMFITYLLSVPFFRKADSINSLGFAVLIISLFNPDAGGDIGLWLSLSAALGILIIVPKLKNYFFNPANMVKKWWGIVPNYIIDSILVTFSATVFTFPIIAVYFKKISTISMLSNIMLIFPVTLILFLSIPLIFMYILNMPEFLIIPIKIVCGTIINYTISCASMLSNFSFAMVYLEKNITILWLGCISICFLGGYFLKVLKNIKGLNKGFSGFILLPVIFTCSFLLLYVLHKIAIKDLVRISAINAGKGCFLLCAKNGCNTLIMCSGEGNQSHRVLSYLSGNGIKNIDNLILINSQKDSYENLLTINQVAEIYRPNNIIVNSKKLETPEFIGSFLDERTKFTDKNFHIQVFNDFNLYYREIDNTKLIFIKVADRKILLCPFGGIVKSISERWNNCDVFIAGGLPSDYNRINSLHTILSMNKIDSDIVVPKVKDISKDLLATAQVGTINIDISNSGVLNIKSRS